MTTLQWDNKISLGHVVSLIGMLFAGAVAYADLRADQRRQDSEIRTMTEAASTRARASDDRYAGHEARLRAVEIAQASQSSDLRNIQIGISEIKAQLDRLEPAKR